MPRYADGFVLAIPRKNIEACRRLSRKAGRIWKEYGALEYIECAGDRPEGEDGRAVSEAGQGEAR
jgi:uncharacterized protein YbaA (DUF1428 family)